MTDLPLKIDYERIKARKGANKARVAIAHRLLTVAWHVLREHRDYRPGGVDAVAPAPVPSSQLS
jgi:transposase